MPSCRNLKIALKEANEHSKDRIGPFDRFWIKEEEAEKKEEKFGDEKFAATVERKLRSVCRGAHNNVRHTTICGCEGIKVRCKTLLRKILAKLLRERNATPFLIEDVFVKRGTWDVWTWEKKEKEQGKNKREWETSGCFATDSIRFGETRI